MLKFKKVLLCFVLSITLISMNLLPVMAQSVGTLSPAYVISETDLQGNTLAWKQVQDGKILEKVTNGKIDYTYTYNENLNRTSKISKKDVVSYDYDDEFKLISEVRGNNKFEYLYDNLNSIIGFTHNNTSYKFVEGDDFNIIAITDANDNFVAKYEYNQNGIASAILGKDSTGKWVDMSKDNSFIGTLNLIRLHSYYFDIETGWYYNGYEYYDSSQNKYIGGTDNLNEILTFEDFKANTIAPAASTVLINQIISWQNALLATSQFGTPLGYSSGWYNSLSDVEILSRLFYGENTWNSLDQDAVAWIVINRKNANFGGGTYRGVATQASQFEPITGGEGGTKNARVPERVKQPTASRWNNAVWLACCLLSTSSMSDYNDLVYKPIGISSQLYFVGLNYFLSNFVNGKAVSSDAIPVGTGITYSYDSGNTYKKIKDVVIVYEEYGSTFQNPTSKENITAQGGLDTLEERRKHNIFFNYLN